MLRKKVKVKTKNTDQYFSCLSADFSRYSDINSLPVFTASHIKADHKNDLAATIGDIAFLHGIFCSVHYQNLGNCKKVGVIWL